jgi:hypothetical protein
MACSNASSRRARSRSRPISGGSATPAGCGATCRGRTEGDGRDASDWRAFRGWETAGAAAQDVLVEGLRLGLGLRPELPLERCHAELILAERRPTPPRLGIKSHQRPVSGLLQRVQRQQPQRGSGRRPRSPPRPAGKPATARGPPGPAPGAALAPRGASPRTAAPGSPGPRGNRADTARGRLRARTRLSPPSPAETPRQPRSRCGNPGPPCPPPMRSGGGSTPHTLFRIA